MSDPTPPPGAIVLAIANDVQAVMRRLRAYEIAHDRLTKAIDVLASQERYVTLVSDLKLELESHQDTGKE